MQSYMPTLTHDSFSYGYDAQEKSNIAESFLSLYKSRAVNFPSELKTIALDWFLNNDGFGFAILFCGPPPFLPFDIEVWTQVAKFLHLCGS